VLQALRSVPENLATVLEGLLDPLGVSLVQQDEAALTQEMDLQQTTFELMRANFSPPAAYAYLLFVLIYFPCVAALATAIREMGAGFGSLLAAYLTVLAWTVATLVYQVATGESPGWILGALSVLGALVAALATAGARIRRRKVLA
jgi:ferrous iron transport protein B